MKDYISQPFLVEKISFEVKAELETIVDNLKSDTRLRRSFPKLSNMSQAAELDAEIRSHNFFILRQFKSNFTKSWEAKVGDDIATATSYTLTASIPGYYQLGTASETTYVEDERELITYGQLLDVYIDNNPHSATAGPSDGVEDDDIENSALIAGRDSVFTRSSNTRGSAAPLTASFRIQAPVRHTGKIQPMGGIEIFDGAGSSNKKVLFLENNYSSRGRDRLEKSSRALYNGHQSDLPTTASFLVTSIDNENPFSVQPSRSSHLNDNSPYILFPEDEIVIGYQYHAPFDFTKIAPDNADVAKNKITFTGPGKLILFGSQIKENKEFHDTLNQPLTSEAVHEALHYDNPVVDQFDIGTRYELSGSYLDSYRDPDTNLATDSDLQIESLATSGNSLAGSLQRFIKMSDKQNIFYDTAVPDPLALWAEQSGQSVYVTSTGDKVLSFGVSGSADDTELASNDVLANSNAEWFRSYVYNNSLSRVSFDAQKTILKNTFLYFMDGELSSTAFSNNADQYVANFSGFNFNDPTDNISLPARTGDQNFNKKIQNALMWLYGFGTGISGSLKGTNPAGNALYAVEERPRGYKYGVLSVVPLGRTAVYRSGKFGQYADMLEQGLDTIYLLPDKTLTEGPVNIKFVARESDTTFKILNDSTVVANTIQSSNISTTATSSLPYIDDLVARNRGVTTSTSATTPTVAQTITVIGET